MTQNEFKGQIFGKIKYETIGDLEMFLLNLNEFQSIYIINQALEYANNNGAFTLIESEFISKCLRILNKFYDKNQLPEEEKNDI